MGVISAKFIKQGSTNQWIQDLNMSLLSTRQQRQRKLRTRKRLFENNIQRLAGPAQPFIQSSLFLNIFTDVSALS